MELSGPSGGRRELRSAATTTTALISVVTTASAGGEDERVRRGGQAGLGPRGRVAKEERDEVEDWRSEIFWVSLLPEGAEARLRLLAPGGANSGKTQSTWDSGLEHQVC